MGDKDLNKGQKYGVYLNLKTRLKQTNEIFDYSSFDDIKEMNTFITGRIYLYRLINNDIVKSDPASAEKDEDELLLLIRKRHNSYEIDNITYKLKPFNSENSKKINNYLWYVINSEPSMNMINPNEDYYLEEGDIIKFGKVKYFVKEIYIKKEKDRIIEDKDRNNRKNEEKKKNINDNLNKQAEKIIDLIPKCLEYKKCEFCNEDIFNLCKCKEFQHLKCLKNWINDRKIEKENNKRTVKNFFINIFYCDEFINKDPKCEDSECSKYCKCIKCNTFYPLNFKYFDKNDKLEKEKILFEVSKPEESNYMILESLETNDEYKNLDRFIKYIHVIKLTKDDINIGRGSHNDVIIDHSSVCREHAVIKYNNGKILLKNKSKKAGTLVLIQDKSINLSEKEIYLQVNKTFIEVKIMEEEYYKKFKCNEKSKYPLSDKKQVVEKDVYN